MNIEKQMHFTAVIAVVLMVASVMAVMPATVAQAPPEVVCVPWQGDEAYYHPTWDGKEVTLKGTVRYAGAVSYAWDFGDGSPVVTGTATATDAYPYPIEARHVYHGADGTMFIATLTVTADGVSAQDTYRIIVNGKTLEVETDVAIDEGLWWLYKQQYRYSSGSVDFGRWGGYKVANTGTAVQAFENNLHKPYGDPAKDPYVDAVRRGLNYLTSMMYIVSPIPATDGDTNGNGFGITCFYSSGYEMYEIGMAMMAIVSSDTPGRVAVAGPAGVVGRTYKEIIQDMCDFCAFAQNDGGYYAGGWRYRRNYGSSDNSVTQWPVIGMEPAEAKWGITVHSIVRPRLEDWLTRTQRADGAIGYMDPNSYPNIAKTAGTGITGFMFCGVPVTDARIQNAINFIDANWGRTSSDMYGNFGNIYAMYGVKKAFEEFLGTEYIGSHLWYNEYARYLVDRQLSDGRWNTMGSYGGDNQLTTAWAILILRPGVYDIPPTAVAKANGFDTVEVDKGQTVNFDGSQSTDGTYTIVQYEWDWESDGTYDPPSSSPTATHAYSVDGSYTVTLRVTDNRDVVTGGLKPAMSSTDTCTVWVHPPPHPPIADANGPYIGWVGVPVTLDGSGSWDPNEPLDEIVSWDWDLDNDGAFDDASGETVVNTWASPGTYPIALKVTAREEPTESEPSRTVVEIGNHDPVADANGPYVTAPGIPVTLDGSGSYDPDPAPDQIVSYEWDLDNDGDYDDAPGVTVPFQSAVEGVYTVRLKVTDTYGATDTDSTIVEVIVLQPELCPDEYQWGSGGPGWDPYPTTFVGSQEVHFVNNGAGNAYNVVATVTCTPINVVASDPDVTVGDIPAGDSAWSSDTFVLRVDMTNPQDPNKGICWQVEYDDAAGVHHVIENVAKFCGETCSDICP